MYRFYVVIKCRKESIFMNGKKVILAVVLVVVLIIITVLVTFICFKSNDNNANTRTSVLSNEEALAIAKEKYDKVTVFYWMNGNLENTISINEITYELIDNYNELTDNLTNNYFEHFKEVREIVNENGNHYITTLGRGGNIYYFGNDGFEVKNISSDKLEFVVKEKYIANNEDLEKDPSEITEFEYKNNSFVLVKEDGKWKVDEFTIPT